MKIQFNPDLDYQREGKLPEPYSEIASNGKRPKLDYTEENLEFANILKEKKYISSVKEKGGSIVILRAVTDADFIASCFCSRARR